MARFVITGTGTGIGKTVFAAGLCGLIGADYWKPLQSGLADGLDADCVAGLSGARIWPEAYRLRQPLSPHRAAELDGVTIDAAALTPPDAPSLVIEGAGGALVPVTRQMLFADLFADWGIPVVVVATTGLGTISHTLTALESLRARGVPLHGVAFVGDDNPDNIATIGQMGAVRVLGRLPRLDPLDRAGLSAAMARHFNPQDFA
ncbi:MAG: dethiobiotin synthase [Paracoccus sp. (in: a-proteobacteria)]|uniref:dethiobiotin synthase n=1 Tax=Paracoccus sp. TaxID=267 RepID=UPI0026E06B3E|nr:dethiobiotin synthase [Paracoccus sp. (in: a-proteobacteria)]MDO5619996.1 dethiobiotin synthase [Paracoccus sp. (in: a-proteobacteria)]